MRGKSLDLGCGLTRSGEETFGLGALMSLLGWILLGLMAGFMTSNIVRSSGQGLLLDLVLGVIGAVVSGYLFTAIGAYPALLVPDRTSSTVAASTP